MSRSAALAVLAALVLAASCSAGGGEAARDREPVATTTTAAPSSTTTTSPTTTTTGPPSTTTTAPPAVAIEDLRPPAPVGDPAALAARIEAAETTIRDATSPELAVATAGLAQQAAYRQLGERPDWDAAVLAALPERLREPARLNAAARREFRGMHTKLSSTLPAWRIVSPTPAAELMAMYREAEAAFGIPWKYLAAINLVETGTGRIRGTSTAGAQGPMQFMPATWAAYGDGGDVNDPRDAIMGAARYLAANNGAQDIAFALYRYNHSARYVLGVRIYADLIAEHPTVFLGYYHWGVVYLTDRGDVYLPVGYEQARPIPVADYRPS